MVRQTHYILFLNINIVFNIHLCYHFCNVSYHNIIKTTNYLSLCLKRRTTGGTRTAQEFRDTTALPVPVVYINPKLFYFRRGIVQKPLAKETSTQTRLSSFNGVICRKYTTWTREQKYYNNPKSVNSYLITRDFEHNILI